MANSMVRMMIRALASFFLASCARSYKTPISFLLSVAYHQMYEVGLSIMCFLPQLARPYFNGDPSTFPSKRPEPFPSYPLPFHYFADIMPNPTTGVEWYESQSIEAVDRFDEPTTISTFDRSTKRRIKPVREVGSTDPPEKWIQQDDSTNGEQSQSNKMAGRVKKKRMAHRIPYRAVGQGALPSAIPFHSIFVAGLRYYRKN
ncbi:hypothetical protein JQC72_15810 [Polycladomyces sp. WAk]|uniref:Uncharacterized protein n=1 Tax=Polycladomyces zharkentensis TaxID=2807616 RepID=A0ABS2WN63_9BACL|nr:hypothetical protein [Polycladomyces sp. WAk]MBN2910959.1 hypothetical protein [Polycladomyces sp. WAk]